MAKQMVSELEIKTEPHRKTIGNLSLMVGLLMFCFITVILIMMEHDNAQEERMLATEDRIASLELKRQAIMKGRHLTALEDAIRDMVGESERCIVIYHGGLHKDDKGSVVHWPPAAERLLGWTWEDVRDNGLAIMIPELDRESHENALRKFLNIPLSERKTSVLHHNAVCKDGSILPVTVSVWAVGDHTRSVAATIDAQEKIVEYPRK